MIEEIRIKDFAIIEKLVIPLRKGFNVLTGETGAGKSIIVDAIGILLKEKVTASDFVKHGKNEASVEAIITDTVPEDFETEDELIILKKILSLQGKTRSYINDSVYTVQGFIKIASQLINIHGQHEHTYLLKKENHLDFYDSIVGLKDEVAELNQLFNKVQIIRHELEKLKNDLKIKKEKIDLLQFQIEEIKNASLKQGEEEELNEQRKILKNILKLKELAEVSFNLLYEDKNSAHTNLSKILSLLKELSSFDSKAEEVALLIESAIAQTQEAVYLLRKLKETYEPDPVSLERVEERLTFINKLKTKYGKDIGEILSYAEEAEKQLQLINISEEEIKIKEEKLKDLEGKLNALADAISIKRRQVSSNIEREIEHELKFLGFSHPEFKIKIAEKELSNNGKDDIEFYFSANPGEPVKPLSKIASGGELSRLMLALKCLEIKMARKNIKSITLIFDEIDAGIGGVIAENVGKRLKELSKHHQVICVTHLPQIAALADNHLKIEKKIHGEKTFVNIEILTGAKRKEEIARMLSGKITNSSLFHAEELLENK